MRGRFYDGLNASAHEAEADWDGRDLTIRAGDSVHVWPARDLAADVHGGQARLSRRGHAARLVLDADAWAAATAASGPVRRHGAAGGVKLVAGLTAAGVAVALFVFVGMPLLSGPLARATPLGYEARMGASYNAQLSALMPACDGVEGQAVLAALGDVIAAEADSPFEIHVRAVQAPMVNALALPGGHVLITDDLIAEAETPDELAAVIAHEVAHIERRHSMQAVWRSLGAGMLLDLVVGGGTGAGQQAVLLAGQASELSYSRAAEAEADALGMTYLHRAGLSSEGMATFFQRMEAKELDAPDEAEAAAEFMSSHPNTARRTAAARAAQRPGAAALGPEAWREVLGTCASGRGEDGSRPWFDRVPGRRDPAQPDQPDQVRQDGQARGRP